MNIAAAAINKKTVTLVLTVGLVVGGIIAYHKLGRLEDPEFTIKDALVITPYPGATAAEVEEEVTNEIEKGIQQLGQLKRVVSRSQRGASTVTVTVKDKYNKDSLPQVWDELRRKVADAQGNLPPGAGPSFVMDDYGDVFGVFLAVTGDGYTYEEMRRYVDLLRRELLLVQDVKKVDLFGLHDEAVYVEMSSQKMAALGISQERIYTVLSNKNLVADGGMVQAGPEYVPIKVTGEFTSVEEIGDLLLSSPTSKSVIYLRDVATVRRGYVDPVLKKLRYNNKPAIGIAVSTVLGGNVVTMGQAMEKRLAELEGLRPIGMELGIVSYQSQSVVESIKGFVVNLMQAIVIVIVVLLLFMGLRSGLIIGGVLLLTILMTMMGMQAKGIMLERISLGALILALGMLVD
ncbi:MAG: efflux RND transporter permease subunit, partial [Phycisphaerae bacterium]|nr:efflux RND transporter permease subunit [Phycisphaerae bacterium]